MWMVALLAVDAYLDKSSSSRRSPVAVVEAKFAAVNRHAVAEIVRFTMSMSCSTHPTFAHRVTAALTSRERRREANSWRRWRWADCILTEQTSPVTSRLPDTGTRWPRLRRVGLMPTRKSAKHKPSFGHTNSKCLWRMRSSASRATVLSVDS